MYYHGSNCVPSDNVLLPRPSDVLNGESVVFATNRKSTALMFIGRWSDSDIEHGFIIHNGVEQEYAREQYPGAFDLLKVGGYVHCVNADEFRSNDRLGLTDVEFIARNPVKIIKTEYIPNVFNELVKTGVIEFIAAAPSTSS